MQKGLILVGAFALGMWTMDGAWAFYKGLRGEPWEHSAPLIYYFACGVGGHRCFLAQEGDDNG